MTGRRRIALLLAGPALLLAGRRADAGCATTSPQGATYSSITWVVVSYSSSLSSYASSINAGMDMWNNGCSGMSGSKYPGFGFSTEYATYEAPLQINYASGHAASTQCNGGTWYCSSTWNASTRTMTVYGDFGDPASLQHLNTTDAATLNVLFGHELGHALGLGDDTCSGGLMNGVFNSSSALTSDECSMADTQNHVPYEGTQNEGCISVLDCRQSPVVIALGREAYQLTGLEDPVSFDIAGDGTPRTMGWTAADSPEAFLFQDSNGNGVVDDGRELFGTAVAANGFEALKQGDLPVEGGNGDGVLDDRDAIWSRLRLWIDVDHDGVCEPYEVFTLPEKGLLAIDLDYRLSPRRDGHGNLLRYVSNALLLDAAGKEQVRKIFDVYFVVAPR